VGLGGPPSSSNTAYYLVTSLQVLPVRTLTFTTPKDPVCAGQPVSLEAPALAVTPDGAQPAFAWRVAHAATAAAAGGSSRAQQGGQQVLQGAGKTFGFTLQPGRYDVHLAATLPDGGSLAGSGTLLAAPCIACKQGVVPIRLPEGGCRATAAQAAQLLQGALPQGVQLRWDNSSATGPGLRNATVHARAAAGAAAAAGDAAVGPGDGAWLTSSCRALVLFKDMEPPAVQPLHPQGVCLSPPNAKWACWSAQQLVNISDNCAAAGLPQRQQQLAYRVACSRGRSGCRVLADGRACVRAADAGRVVELTVAAKDAAGNMAEPVGVLVHVRAAHAAAGSSARCQQAQLEPADVGLPAAAGGGGDGAAQQRAAAGDDGVDAGSEALDAADAVVFASSDAL
jgi:hypothetical protein